LKFDDLLAEVTVLLQRQGRVSYGALKRRYEVTDDDIEDVKAELIDARRLATDEDGRVLVVRQSSLGAETPSAGAETDSNTGVIASVEAVASAPAAFRVRVWETMFTDAVSSIHNHSLLLWQRLLGGQRLRMADYVRGRGLRGGQPLPQGPSVDYAL
jgi:hypothetical protein